MSETLDIRLQGKEYHVACAPGEREALIRAVAFVDGKMREIAGKTKGSGERLAVMAALNIAHELLALADGSGLSVDAENLKRRIEAIEVRLDEVLAEQPQDALF